MGRKVSQDLLNKVLSDQLVENMASYVVKGEGPREPLVGVNYRFPISVKQQLDLVSEVCQLERTQIMVTALRVLLPKLLALATASATQDKNTQKEQKRGKK